MLSEAEKNELITGIKRGFGDMAYFGKFLDAFIQSVRYRAEHPVVVLESFLRDIASDIESPFLNDVFADEITPILRKKWDEWTIKNRLRGQTISNLTAVCVEIHLQAGKHFIRGEKANDLKRVKDGARWEIKGSRGKQLKLTINQSHKDIDHTFFVIYCGYPELNKLHGIYVLQGRDEYFTPSRPGLNMRQLLKEHYSKAIRIYP